MKAALEAEIARRGLKARCVGTGCLGPCARGPVMVFNPKGAWFEGVTEDTVAEVVETAIQGNGNLRKERDLEFLRRQTKIVLRNCGRIDPARHRGLHRARRLPGAWPRCSRR